MNRAQKREQLIDNLEKFRDARGYSGVAFARILGVPQSQWDRWKNGRIGMTLKTAHRLVEQLNKHFGYKWKLVDWLGNTDNLMSNVYKEGVE